jgi:hypothetical protein
MRPQTIVVDAPFALDQQLDQRQSRRHELSQSAIVSILGTTAETTTQPLQGEIRNVSKGGTQLHLGQPLAIGALLRVDYDNNLLLGEVMYCQQVQTGWIVGLRIEHTLSGLTALADAMRGPV